MRPRVDEHVLARPPPHRVPEEHDLSLAHLLREAPVVAAWFYTSSCRPCDLAGSEVESLASSYAGSAGVRVVAIDLERAPVAAFAFRVVDVPTLLVFRAGRVLERVRGAATAAELRAAVERAAAR